MSDEQTTITNIKELNDLRIRVLRGEQIPPEQYLEVLAYTRKIRRSKGDEAAKPRGERKESRPPLDKEKLFAGLISPKKGN